ncbi:MAG: hypothetical protein PVH96_14135 [Gemmatimonadota bacterium]|jgi:hypothetical protein
MPARFRIRTAQGQEISFASHEMFAEFVRSGDLSPDDVVYDAETREWSSALTHPVVLQIETEAEESGEEDAAEKADEEAAAEAEAPSDGAADSEPEEAPAEADSEGIDIGLDLAPAPDQMSPDEQAAAFVKRMEAERASELDFDEDPGIQGFRREQGSSLVDGLSLEDEEQADSSPPAREPVSPRETPRAARPRPEPPRREERQRTEPATRKPGKARKKAPKRKSGTFTRYAAFTIVAAVVVAAGMYFGPELLGPASDEGPEPAPDSAALPPPPEPLIPDTEEALRARAQERFLTTTRALLRDLPPIPQVWLSGRYLANPSDYPEVREAWDEILTTVRQVRAGDNERYRAGYLRALEEAQSDPATRTLRLAGAIADFQGRVAPRAAHYDRVEALAVAALRGHDALVQAEGTIAYEPATQTPVSGDPVIEAVGRNDEAQARLDQVLDMILAQLEEPAGPGRSQNVGEWVWDGVLDAVAN